MGVHGTWLAGLREPDLSGVTAATRRVGWAANMQLVVRGVGEAPFLRDIREPIGERDVRSLSVSSGCGGRFAEYDLDA